MGSNLIVFRVFIRSRVFVFIIIPFLSSSPCVPWQIFFSLINKCGLRTEMKVLLRMSGFNVPNSSVFCDNLSFLSTYLIRVGEQTFPEFSIG